MAAGVVFALAGGWLYDVPDMKAGIDLKFGVGLVLASFLICLVHLNTAMSLDEGGNGYFGLAIGFAMFAAILSFGDTESALFNPAVAIGITAAQVPWKLMEARPTLTVSPVNPDPDPDPVRSRPSPYA